MGDAESFERQVWDMLCEPAPDSKKAIHLLVRALHLREQLQGKEHPDLIWTLSLCIEVFHLESSLALYKRAAGLGERRLALRRRVLGTVPEELARSLVELSWMYYFEGKPFNEQRIRELREEARWQESC